MKRLEEKVKDIVEVRAFAPIKDHTADPVVTLQNYRFTDITSDMMAKWIERAGNLSRGIGMASALAGFRGVGKSHFLAAVGAILTKPELRGQISDEHVRSAAEALSRRPFIVAHVRRGSGPTLIDELRSAVAVATGSVPGSLGTTIADILHNAGLKAGDQPFVLFFDTALGREARVARDDGPALSEAGEIGSSMGMFVGIALDDDIADADGANSSIAKSFHIDYLDQEHLFKIVDAHIFAKESSKVPLLREIYEEYRRVLPGFRWSEQRFLSLYPMHPATLEMAPLIRLYIQDFALLGFASEAGVKILGRPANSLIGLDEMFDSVEKQLRNVEDLKGAFATFGRIEQEVITKTPVATRLAAKLVLKGLFLLSLDGQGATADEISAGMMVHGQTVHVADILHSFVAAGAAIEADGRFRIAGAAAAVSPTAVSALDTAAAQVADDAIWDLLLKQTSEKFSDVGASEEFGRAPTLCTVEWRGALRRGEIVWRHESFDRESTCDWTMFVERRGDARIEANPNRPRLLWRVATLNEQEKATLGRYHVLRTNAAVRDEIGDGLSTQMQIHSIAAERIWQRVFLQDAKLCAGTAEYELIDEAGSAHTLSQVLSKALTPHFDALFPGHPHFAASLGVKEASALIANFFGGAAPESAETRRLVDTFAAPLGLAVSFDSSVIATSGEELLKTPIVQAALGGSAQGEMTIREIESRLSSAPLGLTREARHLVLSALIAQRQFDFVTVSGNRINHRSLDLQIIWDDIHAIAPPRSEDYPVERLLSWARVMTGNEQLTSIDRGDDRRQIIESLTHWLEVWQADNTLAKFDNLPDEQLNTAVWKLAAGLKRSFGAAADAIASLIAEEVNLAECLKTVAELFNDSEAEYDQRTDELAILNKYVLLSAGRGTMLSYVAGADWTGVQEIDSLRRELLELLIGGGVALNGKNDRVESLWNSYRENYSAHVVAKHAEVMSGVANGEVLRDAVGSEMWTAFSGIADLPFVDTELAASAADIVRQMRSGGCTADAARELSRRPVCCCGLGLDDLEIVASKPAYFRQILEHTMTRFRANILGRRDDILRIAAKTSPDSHVELIISSLETSDGFPRLDARDLVLLHTICRELPPDTASVSQAFDGAQEIDIEILSL